MNRSPSFVRPVASSAPAEGAATSSRSSDAGFAARFLDGLATFSIFMLFLGVPVFFTGLSLQGIAFDKQLYFYFWLLLGLVAWVSRGMIVGELPVRRTFLDLPLGAFVAAYVASAFFSVDKWHSFWGPFNDPSRGVLSVLALAAAYYFILSHFNPRRLWIWLSGLLAAAAFLLLWTWLAMYTVPFLPSGLRQVAPFSLVGGLSNLMLFVGMTIPLAVLALAKAGDIGRGPLRTAVRAVLSLMIASALVLLLALYNSVPWPAFFIGSGFMVIFILSQIVSLGEKLNFVPMVVFVAILGFFMIGPVGLGDARLPLEVMPNSGLSWKVAQSSLKDQFFLGSGPGTYGYAFSMYHGAEHNQNNPLFNLRFFQGSGLFFEALPTLGAIGTFFFVILILAYLSFGLYFLMRNKEQNKTLSLGLWSAAVVLMAGSLLMPVSGALVILSVLVASLALAALFMESRVETRQWNLSLKVSPKFALALAFVFLVVSAGVVYLFAFLARAWIADITAGRALAARTVTVDTANALSRAIQYMDKESRYYSILGQADLALANQEFAKPESERNVEAIRTYVRNGLQLMVRGRELAKNDIVAQELLAQGYENQVFLGGPDPALLTPLESAYARAKELEPDNPLHTLKLGQVSRLRSNAAPAAEKTGLVDAARQSFRTAIEQKRDYTPAYLNLALLEEANGQNADAAIAVLEEGSKIGVVRTNQDVRYHLARLYRIRDEGEDLANAERMFRDLVNQNNRFFNAYLNLALVYEKQNNDDQAIEQYQKAMDLLTGDNAQAARDQLQRLIDNVRAGRPNNLDQPLATTSSEATTAPAAQPAEGGFPEQAPAPAAPAQGQIESRPSTTAPTPASAPAATTEPAPAVAPAP